MRILIVDDDYVSRTQLKSLLSAYGDCDAAPNGEAALILIEDAFVNKLPYALITMDLDMPTMKGRHVLSCIREYEEMRKMPDNARSKVVVVTSAHALKDVAESYRQECSGYIIKPATADVIKKTLTELKLI